MLNPGTRVRTRCGGPEVGYYWVYGTITATMDDGYGATLCRVDGDEGGYDCLYDYELEVVK